MLRIGFQFVFWMSIAAGGIACQTLDRASRCGPEVRGAYDIGSGTTKMKVAEVNTCRQEIVATLAEGQIKVDYRDDLEKTGDRVFSPDVRSRGREALSRLQSQAEAHRPAHSRAVATAAFREARNGTEFAGELGRELGFSVTVISQDEEARLGYAAARLRAPPAARDTVTWDIGGGSQQLSFQNESGAIEAVKSPWGAVAFKNRVITEVQGRNPERVKSPNPLSTNHVERALGLARAAAREIPAGTLRDRLSGGSGVVLGIGGVHAFSVRKQLRTEAAFYTKADVLRELRQRTGWSDRQIGGEYAATEVTNLILVYAFMDELGIERIFPVDVNLTDALLVQ